MRLREYISEKKRYLCVCKLLSNMKIPVHKIENYTASYLMDVKTIPDIKRVNYFVDDTVSVDGDAPKKFIGVYDHELLGSRHKANRKNWIRYIA